MWRILSLKIISNKVKVKGKGNNMWGMIFGGMTNMSVFNPQCIMSTYLLCPVLKMGERKQYSIGNLLKAIENKKGTWINPVNGTGPVCWQLILSLIPFSVPLVFPPIKLKELKNNDKYNIGKHFHPQINSIHVENELNYYGHKTNIKVATSWSRNGKLEKLNTTKMSKLRQRLLLTSLPDADSLFWPQWQEEELIPAL